MPLEWLVDYWDADHLRQPCRFVDRRRRVVAGVGRTRLDPRRLRRPDHLIARRRRFLAAGHLPRRRKRQRRRRRFFPTRTHRRFVRRDGLGVRGQHGPARHAQIGDQATSQRRACDCRPKQPTSSLRIVHHRSESTGVAQPHDDRPPRQGYATWVARAGAAVCGTPTPNRTGFFASRSSLLLSDNPRRRNDPKLQKVP